MTRLGRTSADDPIPAIGYIRVSTWFEEKISDELQMAAIQEAAKRRGRRIVKWIPDLDVTGRNFNRKIMDAIEAVETGSLEGAREIWVWKFSRFGRNNHGVAINLARIEQAGGQLISATEDVDATTATGGLTRDMLFALANFESNRIGEQWRETHEYRRVHGLPATGGQRFGYLWQPRIVEEGVLKQAESYEPDPDRFEILRGLYTAYADGDATMRDLARDLNSRGILNPGAPREKTGQWSLQSLIYYLDSGFAAGVLHVHRNDIVCPKRAKCPLPREHYGFIPGAQPQIISNDTWQAYRERRNQRKRLPPRTRVPVYPFSGLVRCGRCGAPAGSFSAHGQRGYGFRCSLRYAGIGKRCEGATVSSAAIAEAVRGWLRQVEGEIAKRASGTVVAGSRQQTARAERRREELLAEAQKVEESLDRASMQSAMGDMPRESYLRVRDKLQARRQEIEREIAELAGVAEGLTSAVWEVRGAVVRSLLEEWDFLPVQRARDLLGIALKEVRIWPRGFETRVLPVPTDGFVVD